MKNRLLCFGILSAFSMSAWAQSSVILYGVLDEAVVYQNNAGAGKRISMDSLSGLNGSRWGLTGAEDLGGEIQAIFTIESGVNVNNGAFGQGGTAFGRQVFVGLNSAKYGSITLGRQYDMIAYFAQQVTLQGRYGGSNIFMHPADVDNTGNTIRANNAVRYMSRSYSGFTFGGEYSVGGVAGNTTANSGYSLGVGYANGPLTFGAAFEYLKNPTSSTPGSGFFTNYANGATTLSQSLNKGYMSASAYQTGTTGVSYTFGPVTVVSSYSNTEYGNLGGTLAGGTARFHNIDFGVRYAASPFLSFSAGYDYLLGKGVHTAEGVIIGNQHYSQVSLMSDYLLSKSTDLYLAVAYQRASGTSSTGGAAAADIGNMGDSSNNHQVAVRAAIRHKF
jgi:predicted porin